MPKFTSIEYKNIQSVGNTPIKISFDKANTLIGGHNGSGKSTMGLALTYGLFGKFPSGVKLTDAINSVNKKNLLVKVYFKQRGSDYIIVRGEKPKKFEIYKDGDLQNQDAHSRDQQKTLEVILGMVYQMFTQIVMLNKERYVPFMEMSAGDRRKVVEDILGISVFTTMNDICKQRAKDKQNEIVNLDRDLKIKQTEEQGQTKLIQQIQISIDEAAKNIDSEIKDLSKSLDEKESELVDINNKINNIDVSNRSKIKKSKKDFEVLALDFDRQIKTAKKNAKFFIDNTECPTCNQTIDNNLRKSIELDCDNEVNRINDIISEMMVELEKVIKKEEDVDGLYEKRNQLERLKAKYEDEVVFFKDRLISLESKKETSANKQELDDAIDEYNKIESYIETTKFKLEEVYIIQERLENLKTVLKDDGIKAVIVKEYIDLMNKKINEYLQSMNFYINIKLDENFKETFHAIHKENFSMANLSTGQKTRVNIAILLALLEVAAIKNSVVSNVLFLDEIFEPLDADGVKDVLSLFKEKLSDKNIFVITQRFDEFNDYFGDSMRFKLNSGFTEVER